MCPCHYVQDAHCIADQGRGRPSLTGMIRGLRSRVQDSLEVRSHRGGHDEPRARMRARFAVAVLTLITAGCSTHQEPDLVRLYAPVAQQPKIVPLIVIPGIMGSRLISTETKQELWPGPLTGLLFGHDFADIALPIPRGEQIPGSPRAFVLETGGLFQELAGEDFYARIILTLSNAAGYTCVPRDQVTATTNCVLFSWDWRKGMVVAATELDELIEQLRSLRHDPILEVDVVAHSAGGLVTRYFARFSGKDVLDEADPEITLSGGKKLRPAILIGTPNYGSITVLQKAIMGDRLVRAKLHAETIATMPGLFQLLPHPDRTWMIDIKGHAWTRISTMWRPGAGTTGQSGIRLSALESSPDSRSRNLRPRTCRPLRRILNANSCAPPGSIAH